MGLPRTLVNINAYVDGGSYLGSIMKFDEPKLAIAMEEYRGGGMPGPVMLDKGMEAMEASLTFGGHEKALVRKFATTSLVGVRLRLVGAYRADDGSAPEHGEVYIGGRWKEIDFGTSEPGKQTEHKYTAPLSYYRRVVDGRTEIEIDMINGIQMVNGVDRYAEIMSILMG